MPCASDTPAPGIGPICGVHTEGALRDVDVLLIGDMHRGRIVGQSREKARPRFLNPRVHCLHLVAGDLDHRVVLRGQRDGFIERQFARLRVRDSAARDQHQHRRRNRPNRPGRNRACESERKGRESRQE